MRHECRQSTSCGPSILPLLDPIRTALDCPVRLTSNLRYSMFHCFDLSIEVEEEEEATSTTCPNTQPTSLYLTYCSRSRVIGHYSLCASRQPGGYLIIVITACAAVDHSQFRFRASSVSRASLASFADTTLSPTIPIITARPTIERNINTNAACCICGVIKGTFNPCMRIERGRFKSTSGTAWGPKGLSWLSWARGSPPDYVIIDTGP